MYSFIKHHLFQYLIILLLFAVTVTSLAAPISQAYKLLFAGLAAGIYFFWGIWHHWEDHEINAKTVLEYGLLVVLLLWILINLSV